MSEPLGRQAYAQTDPAGRILLRLCRWLAIGGGLVLVAMTTMSVASIASRAITGKALLGDFELVQLGCAVAVASFLPWCQMQRNHVIVDFFTGGLSARARAWLDALGAFLLAGVAALVAWRMVLGTIDLKGSGESSMLLAVPIWYAYVPMLPAFALLALAGLYTAWTELRRQGE